MKVSIRVNFAILVALFLPMLASCGDSNGVVEVPFATYLEGRKHWSREDKQYEKRIYTVYADEEFKATIKAFESSLNEQWKPRDGLELEGEDFLGSKRYYRDDSNYVIFISQSKRSKGFGGKFLITIIYGRKIK
jgi:hypothetical protein